SESKERMAVLVAPEDLDKFISAATADNLEAYTVAVVTEEPRMVINWNGTAIANLSRSFLNSNGAVKHATVAVPALPGKPEDDQTADVKSRFFALAENPNTASQRGLTERFDASIGAGSVLFPYGGKKQLTPTQAMVGLLPVGPGHTTTTCSIMASGFDPELMARNPFLGAQCSVIESVAKLVAAGGDNEQVYLTLQEYFERLHEDPHRWGKPFAALLGAYQAQLELGCAAIGGKDSMSGSFMDLDVPPTLVSFAIAPEKVENIVSNEFKAPGHPVYLFAAPEGDYPAMKALWQQYHRLVLDGKVVGSWALTSGGVAEGLMKMAFGNGIGFIGEANLTGAKLFDRHYGAIIAELTEDVDFGEKIGETTGLPILRVAGEELPLDDLRAAWEGTLEKVYPTVAKVEHPYDIPNVDCTQRSTHAPATKLARPRAVIPVFPGTNCEYDTANACLRAGIEPEILVIRNLTTGLLTESEAALEQAIQGAQMIVLPGGFSGGDEPEGSGKFIASFFRNPRIKDAVHDLLKNRDGLMLGICNGFQALVKLGLVPYGEIRDLDESCPTLTFNLIGRHQSRYCDIRVASVKSPWMLKSDVGSVYSVPISHGEGRFVAPAPILEQMAQNGQIATQYVDAQGRPSLDISANPNGSIYAIEGIFSPDGRVFGKMGHTERWNPGVAKNIPGEKLMPIFESGAAYFK
ncbi:MAG: phosphoribosylformylglycinamidine synthase subunit PurQ, partial [Clostridiales bacterium]|nr:phosphoribosylformylglycinamidine synthase subunit PurQ [Clostridiales bacterium]